MAQISIPGKAPAEIWSTILGEVLYSSLLPPPAEDLINNLKLLQDDCEYAAAYHQLRAELRGVCSKWKWVLDHLSHPFVILANSTESIPMTSRVHYTNENDCECKLPWCYMANPLKVASYKIMEQPMEAFIDTSTHSKRNPQQIITEHPGLWLLSIAVDFCHLTAPFSLPALSSACQGLTHLSFSEFHLPESPYDQTLNLPKLNTLTLDFYRPAESINPAAVYPNQAVHSSFSSWRLPDLRNLALKGWVSDPSPEFLAQINDILHNVGSTLQGLLYKLWSFNLPKGCVLHPLPPFLWESCPHLHTIQTALSILLAGPKPSLTHPKLTFVPVHLEDLDTLDEASFVVWPAELLQEFQNSAPWPIHRIRIPMNWNAFYRKLRGIYERDVHPDQPEVIKTAASHWPTYFCHWANVLSEKGHIAEDRHGKTVRGGHGKALFDWLHGFDEWYMVDNDTLRAETAECGDVEMGDTTGE